MLIERLTQDMKTAMKARDNKRRDTLRLLLSGAKSTEKDKGDALDPQEEIAFLTTEAKRRRDSIEAYEKAERQDLADVEAFELTVIQEYLPEQLSADEAKEVIKEVIAEVEATSRKQMGLVMKAAMPKLKGRFPGKDVKDLVMELLA
jgi:uncharacterized protein YqeY